MHFSCKNYIIPAENITKTNTTLEVFYSAFVICEKKKEKRRVLYLRSRLRAKESEEKEEDEEGEIWRKF